MKKSGRVYRYFRLIKIFILVQILFVNIFEITGQELQNKIRANHKIYLPAEEGTFPVIIAIPGCSGVSLNSPETDMGRPNDEGDRLFRRHYSIMAERLKVEGYLVVLIDYLTAEGVLNTCGWEIHPKRVGEYVKESISFVRTIPIADASKIIIIGWSHGGEGVLSWLSSIDKEPIGVQSVVTVYPGCSTIKPWTTPLPVLLVMGESDDIAIPRICNKLVESLDSMANVKVKSYPEARHGFDMTEGPEALSVGNGFTIGRNSRAGNNAWKEILKFLKKL